MERAIISKKALPRAEQLFEAIKSLTGERGIAPIPFKTVVEAAGLNQNQRTSARDALALLNRVGAIKIEYVYDPTEIGKGRRVRNRDGVTGKYDGVSDDRVDELVSMGVIRTPEEGSLSDRSFSDLSPVITVLVPSLSDLTATVAE